MTDVTTTADIIPLRKAPKTGAERSKAYRDRQKAKTPSPVTKPAVAAKPVTASRKPPVTSRPVAQWMLIATSFGLAAVGITMNGWFAHTLGSSEIAGWLFAAIGIAADLIALAIPSCAAAKWQAQQRGAALAGWLVWSMTFAFAVTAGIGFASVNISDVTASRASRVTPAVTLAQKNLADAEAARDRECKGGQGKFCREREADVKDRRNILDAASAAVSKEADPQVAAISRLVTWVTLGLAHPSADDFAMLRLILLSLLPQCGGILLMVARR